MSDLPAAALEALERFGEAGGWEQRARLLMQWGDRLEPLSERERNETNRVRGCESLVWLVADERGSQLHFRAGSESRILRGLLALLLVRVNGLSTDDLARLDLAVWFDRLGLSRQLSPSRSNGLNAVLQHMRGEAEKGG